jgi:pimeloyl-ACP methyl ester carboxylesterase
MRARYPDAESFVERGGVKVSYEVFGEGGPAVVFAPINPIVHSRAWKAQVPYLARRFQVITIDPRATAGLTGRRRTRRTPTPSSWPTSSR